MDANAEYKPAGRASLTWLLFFPILVLAARLKAFGEEHPTIQGTVGGGAALGAVAVSSLDRLEQWMRIASLAAGLLIALTTLTPYLVRWARALIRLFKPKI